MDENAKLPSISNQSCTRKKSRKLNKKTAVEVLARNKSELVIVFSTWSTAIG